MDANYEHLSLEVKRLLARVDMHVGYGHYRAAQEAMNEVVEKLTDLETLLELLRFERRGAYTAPEA